MLSWRFVSVTCFTVLPVSVLILIVTVAFGLPGRASLTRYLRVTYRPRRTLADRGATVLGRTVSMRTVALFSASTVPASSVER